MKRGTGHGGPESMPLYCMMAGAQGKQRKQWATANHLAVRQWMFVDDFIFQAAPTAAPMLVAKYEQMCAEVGIELVRRKCKAYLPVYATAVHAGRLPGDAAIPVHQQGWP